MSPKFTEEDLMEGTVKSKFLSPDSAVQASAAKAMKSRSKGVVPSEKQASKRSESTPRELIKMMQLQAKKVSTPTTDDTPSVTPIEVKDPSEPGSTTSINTQALISSHAVLETRIKGLEDKVNSSIDSLRAEIGKMKTEIADLTEASSLMATYIVSQNEHHDNRYKTIMAEVQALKIAVLASLKTDTGTKTPHAEIGTPSIIPSSSDKLQPVVEADLAVIREGRQADVTSVPRLDVIDIAEKKGKSRKSPSNPTRSSNLADISVPRLR